MNVVSSAARRELLQRRKEEEEEAQADVQQRQQQQPDTIGRVARLAQEGNEQAQQLVAQAVSLYVVGIVFFFFALMGCRSLDCAGQLSKCGSR